MGIWIVRWSLLAVAIYFSVTYIAAQHRGAEAPVAALQLAMSASCWSTFWALGNLP